jgi:hypothetical protein
MQLRTACRPALCGTVTTVLAIGAGAPGEPYKPDGWELFAPLRPLFESDEYEGADRAQARIAGDPPMGPCTTTSPASRVERGEPRWRLRTCDGRSSWRRRCPGLLARTMIWPRFAGEPEFSEITGG